MRITFGITRTKWLTRVQINILEIDRSKLSYKKLASVKKKWIVGYNAKMISMNVTNTIKQASARARAHNVCAFQLHAIL